MSLSSSPFLDAHGHRSSLRDVVDTDSDAREASEGDTTQHMSRFSAVPRPPVVANTTESPREFPHGSVSGSFGDPDPCLPSARRPRPLEISEGPIRMGHKVQGSPSELSTAPTAHEDSAPHDSVEQGATAARHISSPVGSVALASAEFDVDSAGESCAAFRKHRASSSRILRGRGQEDVGGLQERLNVLLELAGRPGWTGMPPQASIEELETDLLQVTGRARRLWKAVESSEARVRNLEAQLQKSTSSSSASALVAPIEQEEPLQASQEEELLERIACLDHDLKHAESKAADERRKSTRLRARIARMRQEYLNCVFEVAGSQNAIEHFQTEAARWRATLREKQEQERQRRQADGELRARLRDLAVRPLPAGQECSTLKLAKHVGHCWTEAWRAGAARREETAKLKETRSRLESQLLNAKADMELETQSLARAEEELQRLVADHRARERIVKEEFAVARATNSLLLEEKAQWLQTRPKLLNFLEDCSLQTPSSHASHGPHAAHAKHAAERRSASPRADAASQALQAAERENKELQATLAALEHDKVRLIQDQEELIRRVRARVVPLQQRALSEL